MTDDHPTVVLLQPSRQGRVLENAAAAVRVIVEDDGPATVLRIDVAVQCDLPDRLEGDTSIGLRAAFSVPIPA